MSIINQILTMMDEMTPQLQFSTIYTVTGIQLSTGVFSPSRV